MTRYRSGRRGVTLVFAVMVMGTAAMLLAFLARTAAERYRSQQLEQARQTARLLADGASAYVRANGDDWAADPPAQPIELDVADLLAANTTGSAVIEITSMDSGLRAEVSARAVRGICEVAETVVIELD